jgi:hypothetical protein
MQLKMAKDCKVANALSLHREKITEENQYRRISINIKIKNSIVVPSNCQKHMFS